MHWNTFGILTKTFQIKILHIIPRFCVGGAWTWGAKITRKTSKTQEETREIIHVIILLNESLFLSTRAPSPPAVHYRWKPRRGGDIGWNGSETPGSYLSYFALPMYPFSPTEQININQKQQVAPKNWKNKWPAGTTTHQTHLKYDLLRSRQTHQTSRADDSCPPCRLTVLSPPSASLSILNGAAHWPEWAHKSLRCLSEVGSLKG